jgi:CRISPR-associated protein Cmr5
MQTRDQKLAAKIFKQVQDEVENKDFAKSYGATAHKLPVLVRAAGLAQALAFVDARGKKPQHLLLDHLAKTVCGANAKRDELLKRSREDELEKYLHLTQQVMDALLWYKRFAQSVLKVEPGTEDELRGEE